MATLPPNLRLIASFLRRLPGVGEKSANRMAFYLLRLPEADLVEAAHALAQLKETTKRCRICMNLTEAELCSICDDSSRSTKTITVIEDVVDLLSFETGDIYDGVYHVLHGKIDPLNNIGPDDIFLESLFRRIEQKPVEELILATNLDMEGEATAVYIRNKIRETNPDVKITRLAYGLPIGANLEYADYMTLKRAIDGRRDL
jgi:recombination protein RecR